MFITLFLISIFLVCAGVIGYLVWSHLREKQRVQFAEEGRFRVALNRELKKKGFAHFNFGDLVRHTEVSLSTASRVAEDFYGAFWDQVVADGQVTDLERKQATALAKALELTPDKINLIEHRAKSNRYLAATTAALADGIITNAEAAELKQLRRNLGLSNAQAVHATNELTHDAYLSLFRRIASDGRITPEEFAELQRYQSALGLSAEHANAIVRDDALNLFRQWFFNIVQDGQVTDDEVKALNWLEKQFGLHLADTYYYQAELEAVRRLADWRRGNLPSVQTTKLLESGEICHWAGSCWFRWETTAKVNELQGELIVSSEQVIFTSPIRSFSFGPSKIVDICLYDCTFPKNLGLLTRQFPTLVGKRRPSWHDSGITERCRTQESHGWQSGNCRPRSPPGSNA